MNRNWLNNSWKMNRQTDGWMYRLFGILVNRQCSHNYHSQLRNSIMPFLSVGYDFVVEFVFCVPFHSIRNVVRCLKISHAIIFLRAKKGAETNLSRAKRTEFQLIVTAESKTPSELSAHTHTQYTYSNQPCHQNERAMIMIQNNDEIYLTLLGNDYKRNGWSGGRTDGRMNKECVDGDAVCWWCCCCELCWTIKSRQSADSQQLVQF